jgi:hypothetical protein
MYAYSTTLIIVDIGVEKDTGIMGGELPNPQSIFGLQDLGAGMW